MKLRYLLPFALLGLLACNPTPDAVEPIDGPGTPTEIGKPLGASTTKTIGPAGGTLATPDGKLTLTFPAGAVAKETPITVQPVENTALNGVGTGYEFGPDGTRFAKPVTFTYRYTDDELAGTTPEALGIAFQNSDRVWMLAHRATVDRAARTITTQVTHFSWWSLVTQFRMDPEEGTLFVGQTLELKLMHLAPFARFDDAKPGTLDELLAPLTDQVASRTQIKSVTLNGQDIAQVNGQMGPDGMLLFADGPKAQLVYQAPHDKLPVRNPVAIGVTLQHGGKAQLMLVSNLTVKGQNNFYLDGQPFANIRADGTYDGKELIVTVFASGIADPTKSSFLVVATKSMKVGSFAFDVENTFVGGTNGLSKKSGESVYRKCKVKTAESGKVIIESLKRINGKLVAKIQVTGKVVVAHDEDEKCNVIKHETMTVSGSFEAVIHE
jgi:hypothetical protein